MKKVKSFYDAIANDEALQAKLQEASKSVKGGYEEIVLPIAKEAGYNFSMYDVGVYEELLKPGAINSVESRNTGSHRVTVNGCGCVLYGQGTWLGEPCPRNKIYPEGWGACSYVGTIACEKNGG